MRYIFMLLLGLILASSVVGCSSAPAKYRMQNCVYAGEDFWDCELIPEKHQHNPMERPDREQPSRHILK